MSKLHIISDKNKKSLKFKNLLIKKIKSNKKLQKISLLKQSRLSVMPLSKSEWNEIINLSKSE